MHAKFVPWEKSDADYVVVQRVTLPTELTLSDCDIQRDPREVCCIFQNRNYRLSILAIPWPYDVEEWL